MAAAQFSEVFSVMEGGRKTGKILVGTASWTDPGFIAHWYPRDLRASDRLRFYAEHFPLVEVNSTFYRIPEPRMVEKWPEQTPARFIFDLKLHRLLSRHSTKPEMLPAEFRAVAAVRKGRVELTPKLERAVVRRFLRGIEPLKEAGKLGALLLQMSPAFSPRSHRLEDLGTLLDVLVDESVAVELRNNGWVTAERLDQTLRFFRDHHIAFVMVDGPVDEHFMVMPGQDLVTTRRLAYFRAHGRNASGYIRGRSVPARFDYEYSTKELKEIAERAREAGELADEVHVVYNNNKDDYAPRAAQEFQELLKGKLAENKKAKPGRKEFAHV